MEQEDFPSPESAERWCFHAARLSCWVAFKTKFQWNTVSFVKYFDCDGLNVLLPFSNSPCGRSRGKAEQVSHGVSEDQNLTSTFRSEGMWDRCILSAGKSTAVMGEPRELPPQPAPSPALHLWHLPQPFQWPPANAHGPVTHLREQMCLLRLCLLRCGAFGGHNSLMHDYFERCPEHCSPLCLAAGSVLCIKQEQSCQGPHVCAKTGRGRRILMQISASCRHKKKSRLCKVKQKQIHPPGSYKIG